MKTILVTGAHGQLGRELQEIASGGLYAGRYRFLFTDVGELDITDQTAVEEFYSLHRPGWTINAAAYTAVDRAEEEPERARLLNSTAVEHLAEAAHRTQGRLVQISTDYVFPGDGPHTPLSEEAETAPRSVYGVTKLEGEQKALACGQNIVIRTSWLYSAHGNNFVKTMLRLGAEREQIGVVADQWGTPTYAADLAQAILEIISFTDDNQGQPLPGLYHYSNEGAANWYEFAMEIMRMGKRPCRVVPLTTEQYPTAAARPRYSVLNKEKIKERFGLTIPDWKEGLTRCLGRLSAD